MSELIDYALLADAAYRDVRGDPENIPVTPEGWKRLDRTMFGQPNTSGPAGFSAEIFQNKVTGEIVISYEGTNPDPISADGVSDWFTNVELFLGWAAPQLKKAALLYEQVKAFAPEGTNITFTGHSLGGGLVDGDE